MSESTPPPTTPDVDDDDDTDDPQADYGLAIAFLFPGIALCIVESSRFAGLPFLILALVFFITASQKRQKQSSQQSPENDD